MLTAVLAAAAGTAVLAHGAFEPNSPVFGPVVGRGPGERVVYLTFDDGPNGQTTERIVNILERAGVPATFFMVGRHVVRAPGLAHDVAQAGFGIGNHTYTHSKLTLLGPRRTADEISWAHGAIVVATSMAPRWFRAPHGYRNPWVRKAVAKYGYRVAGWTFGVWDTARPGAAVIRDRIRRGLRPGAVLLLHDGDGSEPDGNGDRVQTAEALPGIIEDCQSMGYAFRPLDCLGLE